MVASELKPFASVFFSLFSFCVPATGLCAGEAEKGGEDVGGVDEASPRSAA